MEPIRFDALPELAARLAASIGLSFSNGRARDARVVEHGVCTMRRNWSGSFEETLTEDGDLQVWTRYESGDNGAQDSRALEYGCDSSARLTVIPWGTSIVLFGTGCNGGTLDNWRIEGPRTDELSPHWADALGALEEQAK